MIKVINLNIMIFNKAYYTRYEKNIRNQKYI